MGRGKRTGERTKDDGQPANLARGARDRNEWTEMEMDLTYRANDRDSIVRRGGGSGGGGGLHGGVKASEDKD